MFTIYHNSRCSKSRQALALLEEKGANISIINYLETPLDQEGIQSLLDKLALNSPRDIMRTNEAVYKELNLANSELPDQSLIEAIIDHPKLLQRPIVVYGDKAVIGRPPENVLQLF